MAADLANLTIGSAEVMSGCAEDLLPLLPGRAYDAILSSPPYFNTEEYESSTQQSCHRYASYTDWREGFLRPVVEQGCRLLRPGGFFLLNVKDQTGRPIATDAGRIFPRSYRRCFALRLMLPALPHLRANNSCVYLWEPILVMHAATDLDPGSYPARRGDPSMLHNPSLT